MDFMSNMQPTMPKLVAVFPGMGKKTTMGKLLSTEGYDSSNVIEFKSEPYSWCVPGTDMKPGCTDLNAKVRYRNEGMAKDYYTDLMKEIEKKKGEGNPLKVVFISTHQAVLKMLMDNNIEFIAIFPDKSRKEEFSNFVKGPMKGYDDGVKKYVISQWDKFMDDLESIPEKNKKIKNEKQFLNATNFMGGGRKSRRRKNRKSRKSRSRR